MSRAISKDTYVSFMKKYKIRLSHKISKKRKTMEEMSADIYKFETEHDIKEPGLYYY